MSPANSPDLAAVLGKLSPEKQKVFQQIAGQLTGRGCEPARVLRGRGPVVVVSDSTRAGARGHKGTTHVVQEFA